MAHGRANYATALMAPKWSHNDMSTANILARFHVRLLTPVGICTLWNLLQHVQTLNRSSIWALFKPLHHAKT